MRKFSKSPIIAYSVMCWNTITRESEMFHIHTFRISSKTEVYEVAKLACDENQEIQLIVNDETGEELYIND